MDLDIQGMQSEALHNDSEIVNRSANRANNSYPGCADMALGQATRTGFTQAGQFRCRGVRITQKTKLEAVLVDIPKTANFDLYLFQVINGELKLKAHSTAGVGQTAERILMMANPGVYVLVAKAQTYTAGSSAVMAWFGYTQFDQQELNDSSTQATQISGITTVTGTMDHARDMDYFLYQFESGQTQLAFKFNTQINNLFTLEAYTAQGWVRALDNEVYNFGASGSGMALFRVRSGTGSASPNLEYSISFSNPYKATKVTVDAQSNSLPRFPMFGAYNQVGNHTVYTGKTLDANRNPVPFVGVALQEQRLSDKKTTKYTTKSDKNGVFKKPVTFSDCHSPIQAHDNTQEYIRGIGTVNYRWDISYEKYGVVAKSIGSRVASDGFIRVCEARITQRCGMELHPALNIRIGKCVPQCIYETNSKGETVKSCPYGDETCEYKRGKDGRIIKRCLGKDDEILDL